MENMKVMTDNDGIRLLWSLLKSRHASVQASAARAIMPCIDERIDYTYSYTFSHHQCSQQRS